MLISLKRIYVSNSKCEKRSAEYQKYLIALDYKPSKVKKQFSDVRNISIEKTRIPNFSTLCNLITQYNPMLPNIKNVFKKMFTCITQQPSNAKNFSKNTINVTYKRNKNLKELISPSLFPKTMKENNCSSVAEDAIFVKNL